MLLSNLTLLLAIFGFRQYRLYGYITTAVLFVGGLILGPLVQKYAFGQLWTGFPVGYDLTDNKTLIAFFFWMLAVLGSLGKERRYLTVLAGLVMLVIFSIPHSARGSERDPHTGEIKTGMVINTIRNK
jgi:ABC-type transport system involved in cytochrome c biogenesis permease subunit